MNWGIERWVRLYRTTTPEWAAIPWQARGLFAELLRCSSLEGTVECGRLEPAHAVAYLIHAAHGDPELERWLEVLLDDGCVVDVPARGSHGRHLAIRNFAAAQDQPLTGTARTRKWRDRKGAEAKEESPQVDARDECDGSRVEESRVDESRQEAGDARSSRSPPGGALSPFGAWLVATYPDVKQPGEFEAAEAEANPGLDLLAEGRKAFAWEQANRSRRKHDHARYLHNWFSRAQDGSGVRERTNGSGSNGSGRSNGGSGVLLPKWFDLATGAEMRAFFKRRAEVAREVAPELDLEAPVGITSVLRGEEWVEIPELHDLSRKMQAAVLARTGHEKQRDAEAAARMRGEA